MNDTTDRTLPATLHALAGEMAAATDTGDLMTARQILRRVETAAGIIDDSDDPAPVLARRFARAHRAVLADLTRTPDDIAVTPDPVTV